MLIPWPGKVATVLERYVIGQRSVTTPCWGGKVVTTILSATDNFRLDGPNSVLKRLEGSRIPHVPKLPADGRAHGGQGRRGLLSRLRQGFLGFLVAGGRNSG